MNRLQSLIEVSKEWIEQIPKTINDNGCWIPDKKVASNGYVQIWIRNKYLSLHRLVLMLYHYVNYYDNKIVTRHSTNCDRACFFMDI